MSTYVIAACIALLGCWSITARMALQLRREFQAEIKRLESKLCSLEERGLEEKPQAKSAGDGELVDVSDIQIVAEKSDGELHTFPDALRGDGQISAETQEAIKATLSAFLGRKVQIRSAKPLVSGDAATTWSTQGRIAIQESHNQFVSHE